ncbi:MAG: hypothetical protein II821_01715 [Treponema sp.]|nr:hypothetical protein [Treponema sp.]
MAELESGFVCREGEQILCESRTDGLASGCLDKIKRKLTCTKSSSFVIVTNQRIVLIDKATKCCDKVDLVTYINPKFVSEYGYRMGKSGCLCAVKGASFYFKASSVVYSFGMPYNKESLDGLCSAFEAVVKA